MARKSREMGCSKVFGACDGRDLFDLFYLFDLFDLLFFSLSLSLSLFSLSLSLSLSLFLLSLSLTLSISTLCLCSLSVLCLCSVSAISLLPLFQHCREVCLHSSTSSFTMRSSQICRLTSILILHVLLGRTKV